MKTEKRNFVLTRLKVVKKQFLMASSHEELLGLCNTYGGKLICNCKTISYEFKDNLFVPNCLVTWDKEAFKYLDLGTGLILTLPQVGCLWDYVDLYY